MNSNCIMLYDITYTVNDIAISYNIIAGYIVHGCVS